MRKADNLPPSCAIVTKSGNLNFLEPFGPVLACSGTALPLYVLTICKLMRYFVLKNVMSTDSEQLRQDFEIVNFLILSC